MRVGYVISRKPPTNSKFEFELEEPGSVAVGDFVEVPLERGALLARVAKTYVENQLLSSPGLVREHALYGLKLPSRVTLESAEAHVAVAEAVALVGEDSVQPPSVPPTPGSPVYAAASDSLTRLLGFVSMGVRLGRVWRAGVDAVLDTEMLLKHHVAVLGATGSGKSYTCGVLAEEVLELGLPVVILDPHGEYATLSERYRVRRLKADSIAIPPGEVSPDAIAEATEMSDVQRDLLYLAWQEASGPYLEDLEEAVKRVTAQYRFREETLVALVRRLRVLKAYRVFTGRGEPLEVAESEALIVDVGLGLPDHVTRALAGSIVWRLFEMRKLGEASPFSIIVDEAHRFLPVEESTFSKCALRTIAREGRKFGAFLTIASQRVVGLDKDVLSQCGTKIVLRMDSPTDLAMLKPLLGGYAKLLPHLPTGVALVAGVAIRYPTLIEIRARRTTHGGTGVKLQPEAVLQRNKTDVYSYTKN